MSKYNLYVEDVSVEAVFNKLGGVVGAKRFLRHELDLVERETKFERNKFDHIIFSITGIALTGKQETQRLSDAGFRTSDWAKSCMTSKKKDSYDNCHRLEDGREYKIVIIPGNEVEDSDRTTAELWHYAADFGYQKPLAGVVPRIREFVSNEVMKEMGFEYIVALHDPITNSDGNPLVLYTDCRDDVQWVNAYWGTSDRQWDGSRSVAFAFVFLAS